MEKINPAERTIEDFTELTLNLYEGRLKSNTLRSLSNTLEKLRGETCPVSMMDAEKIDQIANRYAALSNNKTEKDTIKRAIDKVKVAYNHAYLRGPEPTNRKRERKVVTEDVSDILGPVDVRPEDVVPASIPVKPAPQEIIVRVIIEVAQ